MEYFAQHQDTKLLIKLDGNITYSSLEEEIKSKFSLQTKDIIIEVYQPEYGEYALTDEVPPNKSKLNIKIKDSPLNISNENEVITVQTSTQQESSAR